MEIERKPYKFKPRTITYEQVLAIMLDMGHEEQDAVIFWRNLTRGVGSPEKGGA